MQEFGVARDSGDEQQVQDHAEHRHCSRHDTEKNLQTDSHVHVHVHVLA